MVSRPSSASHAARGSSTNAHPVSCFRRWRAGSGTWVQLANRTSPCEIPSPTRLSSRRAKQRRSRYVRLSAVCRPTPALTRLGRLRSIFLGPLLLVPGVQHHDRGCLLQGELSRRRKDRRRPRRHARREPKPSVATCSRRYPVAVGSGRGSSRASVPASGREVAVPDLK